MTKLQNWGQEGTVLLVKEVIKFKEIIKGRFCHTLTFTDKKVSGSNTPEECGKWGTLC